MSLVLAALTFIMFFIPAVSYGKESINGFGAIFGYSESNSYISVKLFSFSFMNFLTFLITLAVIVCSVLAYIKKQPLFSLASAALSFVGAIFFLLMNVFVQPEGLGEFVETSLSAGPIISAILLFLSAGVFVAKKLLDK